MRMVLLFLSIFVITYGSGELIPKTRKLIIDTDGTADDMQAIVMAVKNKNVELVAITVVAGCVSVEQAFVNVHRTLKAAGVEQNKIPIFLGASDPLVNVENTTTHCVYGDDGIGDVPEQEPKPDDYSNIKVPKEHAVYKLIELATKHNNLTLVTLGPLTNVALAVRMDHKFREVLQHLVIMGGNYLGIGSHLHSATAEFNSWKDPEASWVVFNEMTTTHIVIVPYEIFYVEGYKKAEEVEFTAHFDVETPLAKYLSAITEKYREKVKAKGGRYAFTSEVAVGIAINREVVGKTTKCFRGVNVELCGDTARGQTTIDWCSRRWETEGDAYGENKDVNHNQISRPFVTDYNAEVITKMLQEACS